MEELKRFLQPQGLTVSLDPMKGRCLAAAKDFSPGEVILKEEPYACVPKGYCSDKVCHGCFKSSGLMKCSACQVVWYCSSMCQKQEWKVHRLECKALSMLTNDLKKFMRPRIRLMVKLYIRRKLQMEKVISSTASDNYNLVEIMMTHLSDISAKKLALYSKKAEIVKLMLPWSETNVEEIVENFSKLACNAHAICDWEMKRLGTGLYPVTSIINHSCLPNAVLIFEGRVAVIRSVCDISKGAEVLISYRDTTRSIRSEDLLKDKFFFTCSCPRCRYPNVYADESWSAIRCKDERCDGYIGQEQAAVCNRCGRARTYKDSKFLDHLFSLDVKHCSAQASGNIKEVISIAKKIEEGVMKFCHPKSFHLIQIRDGIMQHYMRSGQTEEALAYCRLTVPVYERGYPGFHPFLGLRYYTCGKLEWKQGNKEEAVNLLTKAADILKITHGSDSPFVKDLLMNLDKAKSGAPYESKASYFTHPQKQ